MEILKRILSIVLGFAVALLVISAFEWAGMYIFPMHRGIDTDARAVADLMGQMSLSAYVWLLSGYAVGSFLGGLTGSLISGRGKTVAAVTIGLLLTVAGAMNLVELPHPLWFAILSSLVYLPFAWFGYLVVRPKE